MLCGWHFQKEAKYRLLFTYNAKTCSISGDAADLKRQVYLEQWITFQAISRCLENLYNILIFKMSYPDNANSFGNDHNCFCNQNKITIFDYFSATKSCCLHVFYKFLAGVLRLGFRRSLCGWVSWIGAKDASMIISLEVRFLRSALKQPIN